MAIRDVFRNYYNGKPNKPDFTTADLPENRFQLFWQVFNVRKGRMVGLNLLYLAIWLPAILWTALNLIQLGSLSEAASPSETLRQILFTWLLILFPLVAITGPFNAGISLVTHRWAQDQHSFPYADFFAGVKENWRQALMFSALEGLVPLVVYLCADFYASMAQRSSLFLLPLAITGFAACAWFLAAPLMPQLMVSYRLNFRGVMRNALLMALAQLPRTVGIRLLTLALPLAAMLSMLFLPGALRWIALIACILYAFILLAFNKLIWASFANFLGEKYLNARIGAPTDIGLRPKGE